VSSGRFLPENTSFCDNVDWIELEFVEREVTLRFLKKLGIQLYPNKLSILNTIYIYEIFTVELVLANHQ